MINVIWLECGFPIILGVIFLFGLIKKSECIISLPLIIIIVTLAFIPKFFLNCQPSISHAEYHNIHEMNNVDSILMENGETYDDSSNYVVLESAKEKKSTVKLFVTYFVRIRNQSYPTLSKVYEVGVNYGNEYQVSQLYDCETKTWLFFYSTNYRSRNKFLVTIPKKK